MEEKNKAKGPIQLLISRVENMRNDIALLRSRVDVSEKAVVEVKNYIKEQLIELYSQIEAARDMMDEITSFMEELKSEEVDKDETIEDKSKYDNTAVPELTRPEDDLLGEDGWSDEGQSLSGDEVYDPEGTN